MRALFSRATSSSVTSNRPLRHGIRSKSTSSLSPRYRNGTSDPSAIPSPIVAWAARMSSKSVATSTPSVRSGVAVRPSVNELLRRASTRR